MLELCPSTCIDKITEIYAMAGAVYVDGNVAKRVRVNMVKFQRDTGSNANFC
jgi:hypothetical protein